MPTGSAIQDSNDRALLARLDERTSALQTNFDVRSQAIQDAVGRLETVFSKTSENFTLELKAHRADVELRFRRSEDDTDGKFKDIKKEFVRVEVFAPVSKIAYFLVTAMGLGVVGAIGTLIFHK